MAFELEQKYPRGFEEVRNPQIRCKTVLPTRADKGSAGYDFYCKEDVTIEPFGVVMFPTDVKAYMQENEVLYIYIRSSMGIKQGVTLANGTGVIDSTYYNNEDNDGNIHMCLVNNTNKTVHINAGERVAQGVFMNYLTVGDTPTAKRVGGIGSSGK